MTDISPETRECGGDAAAYVLGALEPDEAAAFRTHMQTCVVCRDEVETFRGTVDALAFTVPQYEAPKALRRRVMRAVRAEPSPHQAHRRRAPRDAERRNASAAHGRRRALSGRADDVSR